MKRTWRSCLALGALLASACGPLLGLDQDVKRLDGETEGPCTLGDACDDGNACTTDRCAPEGICQHVSLDGPATEQEIGDCRQTLCAAGVETTASDELDVPVGDGCIVGACIDGEPVVSARAAGTACVDGGTVCDGDGACVECLSDAHCQAPATCGGDGVEHSCGCLPNDCHEVGLTCGTASDGCGAAIDCDNAVLDGNESDVDCGGAEGGCGVRCADGRSCRESSDCASGFCAGGLCAPAWSLGFGDESSQIVRALASDAWGNALVAGEVIGAIDFGGGPLAGTQGRDLFVVKLSPSGKHLWSQRYGGTGVQEVSGVAVDGAGNVVVVGSFTGALDLGGGLHQGGPGSAAFVIKLDDAGHLLWSTAVPGLVAGSSVWGRALAIDEASSILLAGELEGSTACGSTIASAGDKDVLLARLDTAGKLQGCQAIGGVGQELAHSVAAMPSGAIAVAGDYNGASNFGTGPLTSAGWDGFVMAVGGSVGPSNTDPLFVRVWEGSGDQHARAVAADEQGVVVAGDFEGSMPVGTTALVSAGHSDLFAARLGSGAASSLGALLWAKSYGGSGDDELAGMALAPDGAMVLGGSFTGALPFGASTLVSAGSYDVLVAGLDASGAPLWALRAGDADLQASHAVALTPFGAVLLGGELRGAIDLGQGTITSAGAEDAFIAAIAP